MKPKTSDPPHPSRAALFRAGFTDGVPIGLGYLAVSFGFGIAAKAAGLSILEAVLISVFNVTSAGQLAAVPIIAAAGSFAELALAQLVINMRYFLMSISLSQKYDSTVRLGDRLLIGFAVTDEIYAVETAKPGSLSRPYLYGVTVAPLAGWWLGTLLGALAGALLPAFLISALSLALYAMFIAIVTPDAKENRKVALCAGLAILISCAFAYIPALSRVDRGFVIILAAIVCGSLCAWLFPIPDEEDGGGKEEVTADE